MIFSISAMAIYDEQKGKVFIELRHGVNMMVDLEGERLAM